MGENPACPKKIIHNLGTTGKSFLSIGNNNCTAFHTTMASQDQHRYRLVAQNRKARHAYFIDASVEAGIVLTGTEVKSLRAGRGNIAESYARHQGGELYLYNSYVPEYGAGSYHNHEPRRPRKLLLHKREMARLIAATQEKGATLVPLSIYFNERGIAKLDLGVARGKKQHDKRETDKKRDWQREKARIMREKG